MHQIVDLRMHFLFGNFSLIQPFVSVPSKALLAASGRVREMQDTSHLADLGIEISEDAVNYSREGIAAHAKNLANRVKGNLEASLVGLGVDVITGRGVLTGNPHEVKDSITGKVYTAKVRNKTEMLTSAFTINIHHHELNKLWMNVL